MSKAFAAIPLGAFIISLGAMNLLPVPAIPVTAIDLDKFPDPTRYVIMCLDAQGQLCSLVSYFRGQWEFVQQKSEQTASTVDSPQHWLASCPQMVVLDLTPGAVDTAHYGLSEHPLQSSLQMAITFDPSFRQPLLRQHRRIVDQKRIRA